MALPRYRPALVTDSLGELMASIRRLARRRGIEPTVKRFARAAPK